VATITTTTTIITPMKSLLPGAWKQHGNSGWKTLKRHCTNWTKVTAA
jgi:hypothetical protein